jgi:hypothetical protein
VIAVMHASRCHADAGIDADIAGVISKIATPFRMQ